MDTFDRPRLEEEKRRAWVSPTLKNVGTIGDIVADNKKSPGIDGKGLPH